jgi:NCS1 family nucleobase:cation symporter-1
MASVVAVMICDYWLLTKGNVFIAYLYDGSKDNKHYWFYGGFNLQGIIAYIVGIALPFPGFCGTLGAHVGVSANNLGHLGWLISFVASFVVYYVLCLVWPTQNQKLVKEMGLGWEEMSRRDIIAVDGTIITAEQEGYPDPAIESEEEKWDGRVVGQSEYPAQKHF